MQFTDSVTVAGTRRRDDGYLVADARVARTGIQTYLGWEVGKPAMDKVRVYRPGSEVFSDATLRSAAHRPVTNDHPDVLVNSTNWKDFAVGQTSDEITGEGIFIRVPLMVSDEAAINDVESGKQELSAGYTCDLDWTAGTTETGEQFDAIQKNIRINHIAIVKSGRAGSKVRIGDGAKTWGAAPITLTTDKETDKMSDTLRTVVVDGLSVQTTDQGAQAISKLQKDLESSAAKFNDAAADHTKAIATKDEEIGTLKADLKKAQDAAPKPEDLDKLVADRSALVTTVKAIDSKIDVKGISDADLRRAAVKSKLGDEMAKDASDAEISGMFKAIAKDIKPTDPFAQTVADGIKSADGGDLKAQANQARADRNQSLSDAWKG